MVVAVMHYCASMAGRLAAATSAGKTTLPHLRMVDGTGHATQQLN